MLKQSSTIYPVISYDIHEVERFKNYLPAVAKLLRKYGAEVLAIRINPKVPESNRKTINAIMSFPTKPVPMELMMIRSIRLLHTTGRMRYRIQN